MKNLQTLREESCEILTNKITRLHSTVEYYEDILKSSYIELIRIVEYVMNKNDLTIKFENNDFSSLCSLEFCMTLSILEGKCEIYYGTIYHCGYEDQLEYFKNKLYYTLFQSDFFKGLPK